MIDLSGKWIEVFKVGDYGGKGKFTTADLDKIAESYDPKLHEAPVVIGHPAHDQPAYGLVKTLRRAGDSLWAQLRKVDPGFSDLVEQGRFTQRSVALYRNMPQTSGPYLRHLGFLGAQPPEVKGLQPIQFNDGERGEHVTIELPPPSAGFKEDDPMSGNTNDNPQLSQDQVSFLERLRQFFTGGGEPKTASFSEVQLQEVVGKALKPLQEANAKLSQEFGDLRKETNERAQQQGAEAAKDKVAAFMEKLRAKNVPPSVQAALEPMLLFAATQQGIVTFTEKDKDGKEQKRELSSFEALCRFVETNAAVIPTGEIAPSRRKAGKLVQFTEPTNSESVDAESLSLAERAEALETEIRKENPKFSETEVARLALQRARQEQASDSISAGVV